MERKIEFPEPRVRTGSFTWQPKGVTEVEMDIRTMRNLDREEDGSRS
jgi:hypothetical protein